MIRFFWDQTLVAAAVVVVDYVLKINGDLSNFCQGFKRGCSVGKRIVRVGCRKGSPVIYVSFLVHVARFIVDISREPPKM